MPIDKSIFSKTNLRNCPDSPVMVNSSIVCGNFMSNKTAGELITGWGPANQFGMIYMRVIPIDISSNLGIYVVS